MSPYQNNGNICVAIACIIYLVPLQKLLWEYSHKKMHTAGGETAALFILIPMWLLLTGSVLCVTASGGFDWLQLGRPALHVITVSATLSMGIVSFVFVALFLRPGFAPRILFCPPVYFIPIITLLLAILSLNPQLASGISPQVFRLPWTIVAAMSLVVCIGFFGYRLMRDGLRFVRNFTHRLRHPGP